jgi:hypothetical protein
MISQTQSQKQLLRLAPQQIQLMKLLQVPTAQLEQRIKEELEINPALEDTVTGEDEKFESQIEQELKADEQEKEQSEETPETTAEDIELENYLSDDDMDVPDYRTQGDDYNDDDDHKTIPAPIVRSFHEYLEQQLGLLELTDHQFSVADQIIGSIDDDGYLRRPLESIVDDLTFSQNISTNVSAASGGLGGISQTANQLAGVAGAFGARGAASALGTIGAGAGVISSLSNLVGGGAGGMAASRDSHVPVKSDLTITIMPVYSRESVRQFSLQQFVNGAYVSKGYV